MYRDVARHLHVRTLKSYRVVVVLGGSRNEIFVFHYYAGLRGDFTSRKAITKGHRWSTAPKQVFRNTG